MALLNELCNNTPPHLGKLWERNASGRSAKLAEFAMLCKRQSHGHCFPQLCTAYFRPRIALFGIGDAWKKFCGIFFKQIGVTTHIFWLNLLPRQCSSDWDGPTAFAGYAHAVFF